MKLFLLLIFCGVCYAPRSHRKKQWTPALDIDSEAVYAAAMKIVKYIQYLKHIGKAGDADAFMRNITDNNCYCPLATPKLPGLPYTFAGVPNVNKTRTQGIANIDPADLFKGKVIKASQKITFLLPSGEHEIEMNMDPATPIPIGHAMQQGMANQLAAMKSQLGMQPHAPAPGLLFGQPAPTATPPGSFFGQTPAPAQTAQNPSAAPNPGSSSGQYPSSAPNSGAHMQNVRGPTSTGSAGLPSSSSAPTLGAHLPTSAQNPNAGSYNAYSQNGAQYYPRKMFQPTVSAWTCNIFVLTFIH